MTDYDDSDARFMRAKDRRATRQSLRHKPLHDAEPPPNDDGFAASVAVTKAERAWMRQHLGPFHDRDLVDDVLQRIKAGKEATVYACSGGPATGVAVIAAKLYRSRSLRGERNVGQYQQGRVVLDADGRAIGSRAWRLQKAIAQKSRVGRKAAQSSWLMHEYRALTAMSERGGDVPLPIEHGEFALLMEFIGDGVEAAPTLSQVALTRSEARPLFERVLFNLELLLSLGWVHGDLSAHNILYHRGRVVLIDFPQVVAARGNPGARTFFERDVERIAQYFSRAGLPFDARRWIDQQWAKHAEAEAEP
ncbi:MAG TPA: RIO1 family regulatory kinase/ATPase [Polyangiaceae bacterium]|nr:RIO1 family regulatory kinase/ATPase [Polyangiaceae bacterium]